MWNTKIFNQWRSYLSLKVSVLLIFLFVWNFGFLVAMYGFGSGFGSPITPNAGIAIAIICLLACVFGMAVTLSEKVRSKLIDPRRLHNYRSQDFYLLSFITFFLAIGMFVFPRLTSV